MKITIANIVYVIKSKCLIFLFLFILTSFILSISFFDFFSPKFTTLTKESSKLYYEEVFNGRIGQNKILIPDEETAIELAEIYLFLQFGKKKIIEQRPYRVSKIDGNWIIVGKKLQSDTFGGVFCAIINEKNGEILCLEYCK